MAHGVGNADALGREAERTKLVARRVESAMRAKVWHAPRLVARRQSGQDAIDDLQAAIDCRDERSGCATQKFFLPQQGVLPGTIPRGHRDDRGKNCRRQHRQCQETQAALRVGGRQRCSPQGDTCFSRPGERRLR